MNRLYLLVLLAAVPVFGQQEATMRAAIRGGGGDRGKCTIEVEVDAVAEVSVNGDMGNMRTLAGQPSRWRRFECSGLMPQRAAQFRFRGIDGRGRVTLIRDPRENRGTAVIRIEDPKGGSEGYTFDLEWEGADYRDGDRGRGRGRERERDTFRDTFEVSCNSEDGRRRYCGVDTSGGVRLLRQRSQAPCQRDFSWGLDRRGIWVDRGCRADFEVSR